MAIKPLEQELDTYNKLLPELLNDEGKYVVIHDDDLIGVFDTYNDALKVGYEKFGDVSFLVKSIERYEQPVFVSRNLVFK